MAKKKYSPARYRRYYRKHRRRIIKRKLQWAKEHPETARKLHRRSCLKKFGLTIEEYDRLFLAQNGLCAICGNPETTKAGTVRLAVDHNHETNEIRGLLCNRCNWLLGLVKDSPQLLAQAITYLSKYAKQ